MHHLYRMLDMSDVFNARLSCKYFRESITPENTKKLYAHKKKQLEIAMLKNRHNIIAGITKSKIKYSRVAWNLKLTGDLDGLFNSMKENEIISKKLREMKGEYKEHNLKQRGFEKVDMKHLANIYGDNMWSVTKPGTTETIALVPRQMGHNYWCQKHRAHHSHIIVEMVYFQINTGFKDALRAMVDVPFRITRLIPLFGQKDQLEKLLDQIGMYEARVFTARLWDFDFIPLKSMYLPPIRCVTDEVVPSGGL